MRLRASLSMSSAVVRQISPDRMPLAIAKRQMAGMSMR
jgi:hypothetical protein